MNNNEAVWPVNNVSLSKANQDLIEDAELYMRLLKEHGKISDAYGTARLDTMHLELNNTAPIQQLGVAQRKEQDLYNRLVEYEKRITELLRKNGVASGDELMRRYQDLTTNISFANLPLPALRSALSAVFPGTEISNSDLNGFRRGVFQVPNNAPNNTPAVKSAKANARALLRGGQRRRSKTRKGRGGKRGGATNINNNNNETVWPINNVPLNVLKNQQNKIEYYESMPKIRKYGDLKRTIFTHIQPYGTELVEAHKRLLGEVAGLEAEFKTTPTIELRNALIAKRKELRDVQADVAKFDAELKNYTALYNELSRDPEVRNYRRIVTNISFADPSDREVANAIKRVYENIYENDEVPPNTVQAFLNGNIAPPEPANTNTPALRAQKRRLANLVLAKTRRRKGGHRA